MRHLFLEISYAETQLLNMWMREDSDELIELLDKSADGTLSNVPEYYQFLKKIKAECPETMFHGTDIAHNKQMGEYYMNYLEKEQLTHTEDYRIVTENIEQGDQYYGEIKMDEAFREEKMVENFIREYQKIAGEKIMRIYGDDHVNMDNRNDAPDRMLFKLQEKFGDVINYQSVLKLLDK